MGPNGSGKSTLANTLLANPAYEVTARRASCFRGEDITDLPTDERAARGLFLGFQHPEEIPGVSRAQLPAPGDRRAARASTTSRCSRCACSSWSGPSASAWTTASRSATSTRGSPAARRSATRSCRWRCWSPTSRCSTRPTPASTSTRCAQVAARHRRGPHATAPSSASSLITHYQRILDHLTPDVVHVLLDGRIVATGGAELARAVEAEGFDAFRARQRGACMTALDVAAIKRDFPILEREVQRQAPRLPRLRVVVAEAARGARRDGRLLPQLLRQHPPRRVHDRRGGDRGATSGARRKVAALRRAPRSARRSCSRATRPRRSTSSRTRGRAPTCSDGDAIVLIAHGAPRQRRAVAHARRRARRRAALDPADRRLPARPHRTSTELLDGAKLLAISAMSNVLGTINDIRPLADAAHAARRARARRRVPVRARTSPTDVQAWDADFVAFSAHKMLRPERHRRAVGPARAARGDAAVPRRRRDDPRRPPRRLHAPTTCRGSSRPARPPIAEAVGFGAAVDYLERARHGRGPRPRDARSRGYTLDALRDRFGDTLTIYGPLDTVDARRRGLVPVRRHPRPRHQPGARRGRRVRAGRPPLRQAADAPARRARPPPARRSTSTTTRPTSTCSSRRSPRPRSSSHSERT